VLLVDRRGVGASEGDPHGFGWTFDEDIEAGVRFLAHRDDVDPRRIAGLGLSVGGEMMLQTAADTPGLAAVISDGAGARVLSEELSDVSGLSRVVGAPMYAAKTAALAVFSDHAPPADLTTYIPHISPRPILLIHAAQGEVDDKTPEYLAAARGPVEQWEVPRGGHTAGIDTMPDEYAHRTLDFLGRWLR
jgi:pimeloyl-ACP methyl ester carboxylesterase